MLILGLLLILGTAALTVGLVLDGSEDVSVEILGTPIDNMNVTGVFLTGAATMLLFLLGVWMLTSSMGRSRRKRGERKDARREQHDSVAQLEQERIALAAENERLSAQLSERSGTDTDTADTDTAADSAAAGETGAHTRTETDSH